MDESKPIIGVSACLLGEACRHDGDDADRPAVRRACAGHTVVPVCPEVLGGMGTPRPPVHFLTGDGATALAAESGIVDDSGAERTEAMLAGARIALQRILDAGASRVILKERSPSCGVRSVHHADQVVPGIGVFAALLRQHDVQIMSDEEVG